VKTSVVEDREQRLIAAEAKKAGRATQQKKRRN
jgi:hypothetical protein